MLVNKLYLMFTTVFVVCQFGTSVTAFICGKPKEGLIGLLFTTSNILIFLWR